jgi:hypothetical protein
MAAMTDEEERAHHKAAWDAYNRVIANREDDYDDIVSAIYIANDYPLPDPVSVSLDSRKWDMAQRLILVGWQTLRAQRSQSAVSDGVNT